MQTTAYFRVHIEFGVKCGYRVVSAERGACVLFCRCFALLVFADFVVVYKCGRDLLFERCDLLLGLLGRRHRLLCLPASHNRM